MRKYLTALAIVAAMAAQVSAQQVNLSGTWKLNLASSFMGPDHPSPDYEFTKVLIQEGRNLRQTDTGKHVSIMNIPLPDSHVTIDLVGDGQEHDSVVPGPFPGMPPAKTKVIAAWQGGTMLITERGAGTGSLSVTTRRYFLSEDGTHLIELVEAHNSFGDTEQRLVFDK